MFTVPAHFVRCRQERFLFCWALFRGSVGGAPSLCGMYLVCWVGGFTVVAVAC